jgi:hypothetical protein
MKHLLVTASSAMLAVSVAIGGCATRRRPPNPVAARRGDSGWYLMQPPMRHGKPDSGAQLANWQVLTFFDRAAQCDEARARGLSAYAGYLPASVSTTMDSVQMSQRLASSTLCVAADDPRINWFHLRWKRK